MQVKTGLWIVIYILKFNITCNHQFGKGQLRKFFNNQQF